MLIADYYGVLIGQARVTCYFWSKVGGLSVWEWDGWGNPREIKEQFAQGRMCREPLSWGGGGS